MNFPTDKLPPNLDPLQVIDFLNTLDSVIKGLEGLTIESVRNLNSLLETVTESTVSVTDRINVLVLQTGNTSNQLLTKYDAPNL